MSVTAANVTDRAKEFASLTTTEINTAIADAELIVDATTWGTLADLATIYVAAHLLTIGNPSLALAAGPVQSEKVGEVSRSYAVASVATTGDWELSRWGRMYRQLAARVPARMITQFDVDPN